MRIVLLLDAQLNCMYESIKWYDTSGVHISATSTHIYLHSAHKIGASTRCANAPAHILWENISECRADECVCAFHIDTLRSLRGSRLTSIQFAAPFSMETDRRMEWLLMVERIYLCEFE